MKGDMNTAATHFNGWQLMSDISPPLRGGG